MADKTEYLDLITESPAKIGQWVGFDRLGDLHNDWIKTMILSTRDETLLAHRESYKTTCVDVAIPLLAVLQPNLVIMFLRESDEGVKEVLRAIRKVLQSDTLKYLVHKIYGFELRLIESSAFAITTNLKTAARGTSQIFGQGIMSGLTGKHADIIFTDDIVTLKDRVSRAKREHTKLVYQELQNIKNRGGRFFNTATPWHKDDCVSIMPNVKRYTCYDTGLFGKDELNAKRQSMSPSLFAACYEIEHIAAEDTLFSSPKYHVGDVADIYNGAAHIDAAYGGKDATTFTICKRQRDGTIVMLGKRWQKHVDDCLSEIYRLHEHYRAGTIHMEENADKGYLKKNIAMAGKPCKGYHEKTNKYIKIASYLRKSWGNIFWLDDTDSEYMNEILDYTEFAERDDSPDSAASILRETELRRGWNR